MISRRGLMAGLSLAAVPGLARADDAPAVPVRVPVTFTAGGTPLLQVAINGQGPFSFVIDTGAEASAIRQSLVEPLKLHFVNGMTVGGVGGEDIAGLYTADEVVFGGALRQSKVFFQGLTHFNAHDGLIAAGFLTTFPSELDYGRSEVRIYPKGQPDMTGYIPVRSQVQNWDGLHAPRIFCDLTIDGIAVKALVDTGADTELLLYGSVVKANNLWDRYKTFRLSSGVGVTGARVPTRVVTMPDLRMGDLHAGSVNVTLFDPRDYEGDAHNAIIGSRFLSNFSMMVTKAGKIALRPNADSLAPKG